MKDVLSARGTYGPRRRYAGYNSAVGRLGSDLLQRVGGAGGVAFPELDVGQHLLTGDIVRHRAQIGRDRRFRLLVLLQGGLDHRLKVEAAREVREGPAARR